MICIICEYTPMPWILVPMSRCTPQCTPMRPTRICHCKSFCFCTGGLSCHWALWYDNLIERIWDFQPAIMFEYLKVICYRKSWWTYDCPLGDSWSSYGISGSGPISRDGRPIGKHSRKGAPWMTFERKTWTLLSVLHVLQTNRCIMFLTLCRYTILVCT